MDQHFSNDIPPSYGYPPPPHTPPRTNGKSIAAMVLGILSIVIPYVGFVIGIIAIVLSSLSLKEIKRTGEQGRGMAIAGLVCGIVGTALYAVILVIVIVAVVLFSESVPTIPENVRYSI
jgi:NADH:ubiquinone oxidoreductase subunit 6 (subunit J)